MNNQISNPNPTNSKSLFHTMCALIGKLERNEMDKGNAELMIKAVGKCHDLMNLEYKRLKTLHEIGLTEAKLREIEITNPEA